MQMTNRSKKKKKKEFDRFASKTKKINLIKPSTETLLYMDAQFQSALRRDEVTETMDVVGIFTCLLTITCLLIGVVLASYWPVYGIHKGLWLSFMILAAAGTAVVGSKASKSIQQMKDMVDKRARVTELRWNTLREKAIRNLEVAGINLWSEMEVTKPNKQRDVPRRLRDMKRALIQWYRL